MLLCLTKKVAIILGVGVIVALVVVGVTLGIVLSGDDDDDPTTEAPTVQSTESTTYSTSDSTSSLTSGPTTTTGSSTESLDITTVEPPDDTYRIVKIPTNFKIGTATASYQIEGGWNSGGRGPSIWDTFTHDHPERIADRSNGDVAANSYELYQKDVDALDSIGSEFYRFSISWSRVLPTGDIASRNEEGIQYYHKLIDALLAKGIEPMATMYHWDLPQYLQDLGGWMNPLIVVYFKDYADLLYREYGDKIKTWITFNEPLEYCGSGYGTGSWPPALQLPGIGEYYCAHHTLLAHAQAYNLYKFTYYAQGGRVGITLNTGFAFPEDEENQEDRDASDRSMQWSLGIYAHPIFTEAGDYPQVVRERVAKNSQEEGFAWSRLPEFTAEEIESLKGSSDFLGINYYTSSIVVSANEDNNWPRPSKWHDTYTYSWHNATWPKAKSSWLASVPEGLYRTLTFIRDNYQNVETIITENGWSDDGQIEDEDRTTYLELHLEAIVDAVNDGCKVTGHTSWSLIDNFEWLLGYTEKFGIFRVDVNDPELKRVEKQSAGWLRQVIKNREFKIANIIPPEPRTIKIPADFKIGTATASYQIEGGWNADGKGPSIWDTLTHDHPERIADRSNGDVAANSYELYEQDVDALVSIGAQFYRFSIAWSRVLPTGDIASRNEAGIQYYHKLIDALLAKGIEPMATMYHWDLPQYLQDLGGWMNPLIVQYFEDYAKLLFEEYGDKIKSWITFNEPLDYCGNGYGSGSWAPALWLPGIGEYLCTHHTLLANARAYHLYKDTYFAAQKGQIGITLSITGFAFPQDEENPDHVAAADRFMQWSLGIFAHPIFSKDGDYPQVVRDGVAKNSQEQGFAWSRLPEFTPEEVESLKGTSDFLGLNYYTSHIVGPADEGNDWPKPSRWHDMYINSWQDSKWPKAKSSWLASIPEGLYRTLTFIRDNYQNVETIITENGWSDDGQLNDVGRINYLALHYEATMKAIEDGCNVSGHTSWSLIDNFEWMLGYTEKFGIFRVDVNDPELKRVEKNSAGWLRDVIKNREFTITM